MKLYWPMAIVFDNGKEDKMFSYGGQETVEKALRNIRTWNEIFWVRKAWIDVTDTDNDDKETIEVEWNVKKEAV